MDHFAAWIADLETRHLETLRFAEVSRALRALSSNYVERRSRLPDAQVLSGAGKRAAFALFYGPLHYLVVRAIVNALPDATRGVSHLIDLGCGTGAAGAAWAGAGSTRAQVTGIDRHPWAVQEAARTYAAFGLKARAVCAPLERASLTAGARERSSFLAAFVMNELREAERDQMLERLVKSGHRVLIVEPIATGVTPWWPAWKSRFGAAGGRADEWRFKTDLPAIVEKLDRACGMNHRELTARTLYLAGARG